MSNIPKLSSVLGLSLLLASGAGCGGSSGVPDPPAASGRLDLSVDISGVAVETNSDGTKFSTRVIDPIEVNDNITLPVTSVITGSKVVITGVTKSKVLVVNITFKPTVSISSAAQHGTSASAAAGEPVTAAIAFEIPSDAASLSIGARIALAPASGGGYLMTLDTSASSPGSAIAQSRAQLDLRSRELRRDTNSNGSFDDEFSFADANRDCISDPMLDQLRHAPPDGSAADSLHVAGTITALDLASGTLLLADVQALDGTSGVPAQLSLRIAENMRLGSGPGQPLPRIGDRVEASIYEVGQAGGGNAYWADALHPLGGDHGPGPGPQAVQAQRQADQSIDVSWQADAQYTGYRLLRYSSPFSPDRPGGPFNPCQPNLARDWSLDLPAGTSSHHDATTEAGRTYSYELHGLTIDGEVYLGSGSVPPPQPPGGGGGPGGGSQP
jgi:hypothetical protein